MVSSSTAVRHGEWRNWNHWPRKVRIAVWLLTNRGIAEAGHSDSVSPSIREGPSVVAFSGTQQIYGKWTAGRLRLEIVELFYWQHASSIKIWDSKCIYIEIFLWLQSHSIHVWYICLHLPYFTIKNNQIYHILLYFTIKYASPMDGMGMMLLIYCYHLLRYMKGWWTVNILARPSLGRDSNWQLETAGKALNNHSKSVKPVQLFWLMTKYDLWS